MFSGGIDYTTCLIFAGVDTLATRREYLAKRFFRRRVLPETSCLHYLLPEKMILELRINYAIQRHFNYFYCNKKLRYREEHSASVVLSWCTL